MQKPKLESFSIFSIFSHPSCWFFAMKQDRHDCYIENMHVYTVNDLVGSSSSTEEDYISNKPSS